MENKKLYLHNFEFSFVYNNQMGWIDVSVLSNDRYMILDPHDDPIKCCAALMAAYKSGKILAMQGRTANDEPIYNVRFNEIQESQFDKPVYTMDFDIMRANVIDGITSFDTITVYGATIRPHYDSTSYYITEIDTTGDNLYVHNVELYGSAEKEGSTYNGSVHITVINNSENEINVSDITNIMDNYSYVGIYGSIYLDESINKHYLPISNAILISGSLYLYGFIETSESISLGHIEIDDFEIEDSITTISITSGKLYIHYSNIYYADNKSIEVPDHYPIDNDSEMELIDIPYNHVITITSLSPYSSYNSINELANETEPKYSYQQAIHEQQYSGMLYIRDMVKNSKINSGWSLCDYPGIVRPQITTSGQTHTGDKSYLIIHPSTIFTYISKEKEHVAPDAWEQKSVVDIPYEPGQRVSYENEGSVIYFEAMRETITNPLEDSENWTRVYYWPVIESILECEDSSENCYAFKYDDTVTELTLIVREEATRHTHNNKDILDGITSTLVTAWNNAVSWITTNGSNLLAHLSDSVKHITSSERNTWNNKSTVSASTTGTSITEAKYLTVNGTEYKLPSGGSGGGALYLHKCVLQQNQAQFTVITPHATPWSILTQLYAIYGAGMVFPISKYDVGSTFVGELVLTSSGAATIRWFGNSAGTGSVETVSIPGMFSDTVVQLT